MTQLHLTNFLIVGAGAAGLMTARELARAGMKVTILEARDRCGGRIYEVLCARWLENPYYQFFCGELSFCHQLPFDRSSLTHWREIARKAEERLGRRVRVMRFDELDALEVYDAIWASASLLHVPRSSLSQILTLIFNALKPGGLHFASYKGGGEEGRDRYGRYFNYLSREDVIEAYGRSGPWEVVSVTKYLGGGYDGQQGPWVAVTVRRPG
jgi:glycine/D-amino acid oxidase-like deaminating enzyme